MLRLEVYAIVFVLLLAGMGAAYYKGGADKERSIHEKEAAQMVDALRDGAIAAASRAEADDIARTRAQEFIERAEKGLTEINRRFANVPQVVVDSKGCSTLSDGFRMRWNAVETVLSPGGRSTQDATDSVPVDGVPVATGIR